METKVILLEERCRIQEKLINDRAIARARATLCCDGEDVIDSLPDQDSWG
jgi:hypothetical protein